MSDLSAEKIVRSPSFHIGVALLAGVGAFGITAIVSKYIKNNFLSFWHVGLGAGSLTFAATLMTQEIALPVKVPSPSRASGVVSGTQEEEVDPYGGSDPGEQPGVVVTVPVTIGPSVDIQRPVHPVVIPSVDIQRPVHPVVQPGGGISPFGQRPPSPAPVEDSAENLARLKEFQAQQLRTVGPYLLQDPENVSMLSSAEQDAAVREFLLNGIRTHGENWYGTMEFIEHLARLDLFDEVALAAQQWTAAHPEPQPVDLRPLEPPRPIVVASNERQKVYSRLWVSLDKLSEVPPSTLDDALGHIPPEYATKTANELKSPLLSILEQEKQESLRQIETALTELDEHRESRTAQEERRERARLMERKEDTIESFGNLRRNVNDVLSFPGRCDDPQRLLQQVRFVVWKLDSGEIALDKKKRVVHSLAEKFGACDPTWLEESRRACLSFLADGGGVVGNVQLQHYIQKLKEDLMLAHLSSFPYNSQHWHSLSYVRVRVGEALGLNVAAGRADHYNNRTFTRAPLNLSNEAEKEAFIQEFLHERWTPENIIGGVCQAINDEAGPEDPISRSIQELLYECAEKEQPFQNEDWDSGDAWFNGFKINETGVEALLVHLGYLGGERVERPAS